MLAGSPASALPETKVGLPRSREPGMRVEDTAPILAKLDVERGHGSEICRRSELNGPPRGFADYVVVADKDRDAFPLGALVQLMGPFEIGAAHGFFDQH